MEKLLICFLNKNISCINEELLNKFDEKGFNVHVFENLSDVNLSEIDVLNIVKNILLNYENTLTIYIMSDIKELIVDAFSKYSWDYEAFIYINYNNKLECIDFNCQNQERNFNFYSLKEIDTTIETNLLDDNLEFNIKKSHIDNFLKSAKEMIDGKDQFGNFGNIQFKGEKIKEALCKDSNTEELEEYLRNNSCIGIDEYDVYMMSYLINIYNRVEDLNKLINIVIKSTSFTKERKFFLLGQIKNMIFLDSNLKNEGSHKLLHELYSDIFKEFSQQVGEYEFIEKTKRNKNLIFVVTDQLLGLGHGPTKTTLDRCYILMKYMKKNVVLINTAENLSWNGITPLYRINGANRIDEYVDLDYIEYKDIKIPFYQSDIGNPNVNEYKNILDMVKKYKPYYLVEIGDILLSGDLCSKIIPTITIPLSNVIPETMGTFKSTYSNDIKLKKDDYSIIKSKFTFDFKPQSHSYKKSDFKIPENKFVIAIVGGRLPIEIDDKLLKMLDELSENNCFTLFIGGFELSQSRKEEYKNLADNCMNMGMQKDVLAILELVDIYVNPLRQGGGTSGLEAMYKGKPAVSINFGDVAAVIGKVFCVNDFNEMKSIIIKYKNDRKFYVEMSKKAKEVADDLMDSKKYFIKLCDDLTNNKLFK